MHTACNVKLSMYRRLELCRLHIWELTTWVQTCWIDCRLPWKFCPTCSAANTLTVSTKLESFWTVFCFYEHVSRRNKYFRHVIYCFRFTICHSTMRLCTPNEYVHTGQAHANVCKLQIKRGITRCRLTPTFVFKRKFWKYVFAHLFLFLKIISRIIRLQ